MKNLEGGNARIMFATCRGLAGELCLNAHTYGGNNDKPGQF